MKGICLSAAALLAIPMAARAADELVDTKGAALGAPMNVEGTSAGLGKPLDVTRSPSAGLGAPMNVSHQGPDPVRGRVLSPFEGRRADALPAPLPLPSELDVVGERVRGLGIQALDWMAPSVRRAAAAPRATGSTRAGKPLITLTTGPLSLTPRALALDGQYARVTQDPAFGLPRYAQAWQLGDQGTLFVGIAPVDGLVDAWAAAKDALVDGTAHTDPTTTMVASRLAGRAAMLVRAPGLALTVSPLGDVYGLAAAIEGPAAENPSLVQALFDGLTLPQGLNGDVAVAEALEPGSGALVALIAEPFTGTLDTALDWVPGGLELASGDFVPGQLERATQANALSNPALALSTQGTWYFVNVAGTRGAALINLGRVNAPAPRVAGYVARKASRIDAVLDANVQGLPAYALLGTFEVSATEGAPTADYLTLLVPLADGTTLVGQFYAWHNARTYAQVTPLSAWAPGVLARAVPDGALAPETPPAVGQVRLTARRARVPAASPLHASSDVFASSGRGTGAYGATSLGYGTGGLYASYEPRSLGGQLLFGAQLGRIVAPEGDDEDGGFDLFAHYRYELPMQFVPNLTTEVSGGLHFGIAGISAVGLGLRAAATYRLLDSVGVFAALQSQHYPNAEVNGTWLAFGLGVTYRPGSP